MTGALFSEKCARGNFSAPFAQWRSPNASLDMVGGCQISIPPTTLRPSPLAYHDLPDIPQTSAFKPKLATVGLKFKRTV